MGVSLIELHELDGTLRRFRRARRRGLRLLAAQRRTGAEALTYAPALRARV
jgi:hypothetical protein